MSNLLKETLSVLHDHGKTPSDVVCVMGEDFYTDWENFASVADVEYDNGYGAAEVAQDLIILGRSWWMERNEYDGSEWWDFKCLRTNLPEEKRELSAVTVGQALNLGFPISYGWESLKRINGVEE